MRYLVLSFLCAATVIAYVQRSALGVPSKAIEAELGISPAEMGLVMGVWYWAYAFAQLPAGWVADRLGSRTALVLFVVVWSAFTGLVGLATGFPELLLLWGLMGVTQSGLFPCSTKAIGALFPPAGRAFGSGMLGCCMALGWMVSPWVTNQLVAATSWQSTFALYSLPGLVWVAAFALLVSRYVEPTASRAAGPIDWRKLVTDVPMILLCLQQCLRAGATAFFFTWFIRFLTETRGVTTAEAAELAIWPGVGGMFGGLTGGTLSAALLKWTGNPRLSRQGLSAFAMTLGATFTFAASFAADLELAVALLSVGAFWGYACGVGGYSVAIEYGGKRVATVFATMNMCGNIGAGLFPFVVGWIVNVRHDWNLALQLVAALYATDAVIWCVLNPKGTLFEEPAGGT